MVLGPYATREQAEEVGKKIGMPSFVVTLALFIAWQGVILQLIGNGGTLGHYGLFQFDILTWESVGGHGDLVGDDRSAGLQRGVEAHAEIAPVDLTGSGESSQSISPATRAFAAVAASGMMRVSEVSSLAT